MFYRSSGQIPLALPEVSFQQLDNVCLDSDSAVTLGKIFAKITNPKAGFILLVGLRLTKDLEDPIHGQKSCLAQFLHLNCLRKGGSAVFALRGFQKIPLFLFGQIG